MKGNKKVLVAALLLFLLTVTLGTYAIYRTSLSGNGTVRASRWSAIVKKGSTQVTTLNFTLADITWTGTHHGKNNTIAPGDTGTITFTVDLDGSEVDAKVLAEVGTLSGTGLETSRFSATVAPSTVQSVAYGTADGSMEKTFTITVTWLGDTDNLAENGKDVKDVSMQGIDITIPVTVTAYQDMAA